MPASRRRHLGALLLLIGGALEVAQLIVFTWVGIVVVLAEPVSIVVGVLPTAVIGAGLITTGVSLRGWARGALIVTGVLWLVVVVVNIVQIATHSPLGPAPSELARLVSFAAVIVAAVVLLRDPAVHGPARWAIAIPAACILLNLVALFTVPVPGPALLPGLGFAVAGALLIRPVAPRELPASAGAR